MSNWETKPKIERIEAIHYDGDNNPFGLINEHICGYRMCELCGGAREKLFFVPTKSGSKIVKKGDYVIRKSDGSIHTMTETYFLDNYQKSE